MNNSRKIEKFVNNSIKKGSFIVNEIELQNLFELMTTEDIQMFWLQCSSEKAFHETSNRIPHWKTNEQEKYFKSRLSDYYNYPTKLDANGKYIIERDDLVNHIKTHIINYIKDSIQSKIDFKNKTFLEKLPFFLVSVSLIIIPIIILCFIFSKYDIFQFILIICLIIWGIIPVVYSIIKFMINRKYKTNIEDYKK